MGIPHWGMGHDPTKGLIRTGVPQPASQTA